MAEVANDNTERDEIRQYPQQQRQPLGEELALETQIETGNNRQRGRKRVVRRDQQIAVGQTWETHHFADR